MSTIIIYGAGSLGRTLLPDIKEKEIQAETLIFADGNPQLWGSEVAGLKVINPEDILNTAYERIILTTTSGMETVTEKLIYAFNVPIEKIDTSYIQSLYDRTMETRNRFLVRFAEVVKARRISGNCAEGGVYEGYFAKRINAAFSDRTLWLFDTFEGFDARDIAKEDGYVATRTGDFNLKVTEHLIKSRMPHPEKVIIKKGYFPETTKGVEEQFVFVNLDFDLYAPTLAGLQFFYPRMVSGGVILIHDYFCDLVMKSVAFDKVQTAVDEFCAKNNVAFIPIGDEMSVAIVKP